MNRLSKFPVFYTEQQGLKLGSMWPPSLTEHQDKTGFLPALKGSWELLCDLTFYAYTC